MAIAAETLVAPKRRELRAKLASITIELEHWSAASGAGEELEKFNTRVRAIRTMLAQVIQPLERRLLSAPTPRVLELAPDLELSILEIHRVWEFFRAKLALRYVPWLQPYLLAADELAWRCYSPVLGHLRGVGREPPLVFLNGASSPFTMPRGTAYTPEDVPGEAISSEQLKQALQSLPIPVIGVPWAQLQHLPEALVIAHEVGHDVQQDLHLDGALKAAVCRAVPDEMRQGAWLSWRDEVFADTFGTLLTGPAFAGAMTEFLARAPRFIATERPSPGAWGRYPTAAIRVSYVLEVLQQRGFAADARRLRERWLTTYPQQRTGGFADDVPEVARAMIATPFGALHCKPLTALGAFTNEMQEMAGESAADALHRQRPRADDARTLVAAARIAYESGDARYVEHEVASRLLRKIRDAQQVGVRGAGAIAPAEALRDARDHDSGVALAELIGSAHGWEDGGENDRGGPDV